MKPSTGQYAPTARLLFCWTMTGYSLPTTNTDNAAAKANQLANFPLNFLRTGGYYYSDGKLYGYTSSGYWWSATRLSAASISYLRADPTSMAPQNGNYRGYGFALRWGDCHNNLDAFLMVVV